MRIHSFGGFAALLLCAGCVINVGAGAALASPAGSAVTLETTTGAVIDAELLEARDTALVVLHESRVTLVPMRALATVNVRAARLLFRAGTRLGPLLHEVSVEARYPQGISDALLARLLAEMGQPALVVRDR